MPRAATSIGAGRADAAPPAGLKQIGPSASRELGVLARSRCTFCVEDENVREGSPGRVRQVVAMSGQLASGTKCGRSGPGDYVCELGHQTDAGVR